MFEKEAEEYQTEKRKRFNEYEQLCWGDVYKDWKNGAEFGYNKAKVEVEESYRESLCNSELNLASVTEQLEELKKANEWHYIKDGKYPTDEKDVEVLYQDCDKINVYNCVYDIHAENWLYYNLDDMGLELFPFNVIAWKEIVLPELKESE